MSQRKDILENEYIIFNWYVVQQREPILDSPIRWEHFVASPSLRDYWKTACDMSHAHEDWTPHKVNPNFAYDDAKLLDEIQNTLTSRHLVKRAEVIQIEYATMNELANQAYDFANRCKVGELSVAEVSAELEAMRELTVDCIQDSTRSSDEILEGIIDELVTPGRKSYLPAPGYIADTYGHYEKGKTYYVGAKTSCFKTTTICESLRVIGDAGHRCLMWTLEDNGESLVRRDVVAAGFSDVDYSTFSRTFKDRNEIPGGLFRAGEKISRRNIRYGQEPLALDALKSRVTRACHKHKIECVAIDFIQRIKRMPGQTMSDHIELCANELADLAKKLNVVMFVGAQFTSEASRAMDNDPNRMPSVHDFKGGSAIEQSAHAVILNHVPKQEGQEPGPVTIKVIMAKWKNGPKMRWDVVADGARDTLTLAKDVPEYYHPPKKMGEAWQ